MVYASNKFLDILNNEKQSYLLNKGSQSDIIEEVTILELKITNTAIDILNQDNKEIEEIIKADHRYTLMSTQKEKCREIIQNHINQLVAKFLTDKHGTSDHSLAKLAGAKIDEHKLNEIKDKNEAKLKKEMNRKNDKMDLDKSQPEEDLSKINYDNDDDSNKNKLNSKKHKSRSRSRSRSKSRNRF